MVGAAADCEARLCCDERDEAGEENGDEEDEGGELHGDDVGPNMKCQRRLSARMGKDCLAYYLKRAFDR